MLHVSNDVWRSKAIIKRHVHELSYDLLFAYLSRKRSFTVRVKIYITYSAFGIIFFIKINT